MSGGKLSGSGDCIEYIFSEAVLSVGYEWATRAQRLLTRQIMTRKLRDLGLLIILQKYMIAIAM